MFFYTDLVQFVKKPILLKKQKTYGIEFLKSINYT